MDWPFISTDPRCVSVSTPERHEHCNTPNIWDACFYCGVSLDGGCPPEEWTDYCEAYTPELEEKRMEQVRAYVVWRDSGGRS